MLLAKTRREERTTHPAKVKGHHEHKVGGKYHEEVPCRVLRNAAQNGRNLEPSRL